MGQIILCTNLRYFCVKELRDFALLQLWALFCRQYAQEPLEDMAQNGQDPQLTFLKQSMLLSDHFYETLGQKLNVWQQC